MGNLYIQLYAKLWDKRIWQNVKFEERQKGFIPVDGCFENVKILQELLNSKGRDGGNITLYSLTWRRHLIP